MSGESALKYANDQMDRDERARARQEEREEKARKEEREEKARQEEREEKARQEREQIRQHEAEMERLRLERAEIHNSRDDVGTQCSNGSDGSSGHTAAVLAAKRPKLPAFVDETDDLDSYLNRFERLAKANGWDKADWAVNRARIRTASDKRASNI